VLFQRRFCYEKKEKKNNLKKMGMSLGTKIGAGRYDTLIDYLFEHSHLLLFLFDVCLIPCVCLLFNVLTVLVCAKG